MRVHSEEQRNNNDELATKNESPVKSEEESPETDVGFNVEGEQEDWQIDEEVKRFQTHILMLQGKAYLELRKTKHAQKKLETALRLNKHFYGESHGSNASIYTILAQVHTRTRDFDKAIEYLELVWEITEALHGMNSSSLGSVYLELAEVYYKKRALEDAIGNQKKAFEIFEGISASQQDSPISSEFLAGVALTLSEWLEKLKKIEEALVYLRKVEEIYSFSYGAVDRRTVKVKRSIALFLLKISDYSKALEVLNEVEEVEKTIFGEDSLQIAKTLKVIGTIQIIINKPQEARQSLTQAAIIFKVKGQPRLQREALDKLKMLHKTVLEEDEQRIQEEMLSPSRIENLKSEGAFKSEDGDDYSPVDRPRSKKAGKRKVFGGKGQGTASLVSDYDNPTIMKSSPSFSPAKRPGRTVVASAVLSANLKVKRKLKKAISQGNILPNGKSGAAPPKRAWGSPSVRRHKVSGNSSITPNPQSLPFISPPPKAHLRNKKVIFS